MRYTVYTDGSGSDKNNVIGSAYLILTEDTYIHAGDIKIEGIDNPTWAEMIALGLAAKYLLENCDITDKDVVDFNIDCLAAVKFCDKYVTEPLDAEVACRNARVIATVQILRVLNTKCKVTFNKVRAHKNVSNPNTFVDRVAKLAMRR